MSERTRRNPFQNEADAFRILVMVVIAGAIVIAAAELVGSWLGFILLAIAASFAVWAIVGWLREELSEPDSDQPPTDG